MGRSPKSLSTATMPPALSPGPQAAERHLHVAGRPLALRPKCGCKASTALDFCLIDRALGAERGQGTGAGAAAAAGGRGAEEAEEEAECLGAAQVGPPRLLHWPAAVGCGSSPPPDASRRNCWTAHRALGLAPRGLFSEASSVRTGGGKAKPLPR